MVTAVIGALTTLAANVAAGAAAASGAAGASQTSPAASNQAVTPNADDASAAGASAEHSTAPTRERPDASNGLASDRSATSGAAVADEHVNWHAALATAPNGCPSHAELAQESAGSRARQAAEAAIVGSVMHARESEEDVRFFTTFCT